MCTVIAQVCTVYRYLCVCVVSALTVCLSIDGALVEGHDVLSECSSLVTEDVFNLKRSHISINLDSV